MKKPVLILSFAVALFAAGCGSDKGSSGSGQSTGSGGGGQTSPSSSGGGGATVSVAMKNIAFQPKSVTVKKGGTVKWTNDDSVGHDVTKESGPGPKFKSGPAGGMQSGDTFEQKFPTAGTIKYECTVHPNMRATVTVK